MVKLYINNQEIELGADTSLPINYQIEDITSPGNIKSEFSKTISLPSNKNNDDVLNHLYRVDRKNIEFNVSSKIPFEIRYNNRRFQTGYVKFGDITVAEDGTKTYDLNLFGKLGEFFLELADKKMVDLDFDLAGNPKLQHTLNRYFIDSNWDREENLTGIHNYIRYIPTFQGEYENFNSDLYLDSNLDVNAEPLPLSFKVDEFGIKAFSSYRQKVALNNKKIIDAIKTGLSGYTFDDDSFFYDLNEYFAKSFIMFGNFSDKTIGNVTKNGEYYLNNAEIGVIKSGGTEAYLPSSEILDELNCVSGGKTNFNPTYYSKILTLNTKLNTNIYISSGFPVNNRDVYCNTWVGNETFTITYREEQLTSSSKVSLNFGNSNFRIFVPANTTKGYLQTLVGGQWQFPFILNIEKDVVIQQSNINENLVKFNTVNYPYSSNTDRQFKYVDDNTNAYIKTFLSVDNIYLEKNGINNILNYDFSITLPDVVNSFNNVVTFDKVINNDLTQKDYLLEFCRLFGLYITVKNNIVKIDTRNSFFGGKSILDWSDKIDLSKDKTISPLVFDKQKLIFGFKEDTSSNFLKSYKDEIGYNYGDKVIDTGFEFNSESLKLMEKTIFNPIILTRQTLTQPVSNGAINETITLPSSYNITDNKRVKVKDGYSFLFRNGDLPLVGPSSLNPFFNKYFIFDDTLKMQRDNKYYYNLNGSAGAYNNRETIPKYSTKLTNKSFEFSRPEIVWDETNETNYPDEYTLYNKFWKKYIEDRYNVDTKMLKAYFMLTPVDVENITLGEFIFFDGQYWTINKIVDYDITKQGVSTQVELISVQDLNNYTNGQVVDSAIIPTVTITTDTATLISYTSANSGGNILSDVPVTQRGLCWSTSHNPTVLDNKTINDNGTGSFNGILNGLTNGTLYYVRAYAIVNSNYYYGNEISFTTTTASYPTIVTSTVINIGGTTAQSGGESIFLNGGIMVNAGICWSTSVNPTIANSKVIAVTTPINFISSLTGLTLNTTYHVRAFITTNIGTSYGSDLSFLTHNIPSVTSNSASSITNNTAVLGGNVTNEGLDSVTSRGIVYGYYQNPTVGSGTNFTTVNGSGFGSFTSNLSALLYNQLYYVRAYATNVNGTAYGSQVSFTTTDNALTSTNSTSNVTTNSATVNYTANSNSGSIIYQRGVCYSTSQNPTTANSHTNDGDFDGTFNTNLTGLIGSTTYYVRSYVINSNTTFYGNQLTFTTFNLPTLNTTTITNITNNSATGGGNVLTDGGTTVTSRGVCWATSSNPTTSNNKTNDGTGTGSFTSSITGLSPYTTYYVRAYATNQFGTTYGNEVSLISKDVATVSMYSNSNFGNTYTTFTGKVESTGGVSLINKGFVWQQGTGGFDINTYTGKYSHGSTVEDFTTTPNNLVPNTYYQVKAWITNQYGTTYSPVQTFTTKDVPVVVTSMVGSIYDVQVTAYGNVTFNGGVNLTRRGFVYATTQNPTISNSFVNDGGQTGSYNIDITGLTHNTTYYVRAFAENVFGITYGSQMSVLTSTVPSLTTDSYNSLTSTSVIVVGNVTSGNGGDVVERGVVYGTSTNPIYSGSKVINGSGLGVYSTSITGLTPGQTYYVRCYAINQFGINYGGQLTLTNLTLPWVEINNINSITLSTATANSDTVFDGYTPLTARGVCWSTSSNPTTSNSKTVDGTAIGNYNSSITGLAQMTTYYVRAYATNSVGTSYSDNISFTTYGVPSVNIGNPDQVQYQSALITGSIASAGGTTITQKGFVWRAGTAGFDIVSNDGIYNDGSGTNNFSHTMANLTNNTFYQVKAFATNAFGTSYSTIKTFTTMTAIAPYVKTSSFASNIGTVSATCQGNLIANGGANIVRKGICYSKTNSVPTINDSQVYINDGSLGFYNLNLTDLIDDSLYYFRAFAYSDGVAILGYGDVATFTTLNTPDAPTVQTDSYSIVNYSSVNGTGTVLSDRGASITERGLVIATNSNPYIGNGTRFISSGTVGQFTTNMYGLTQNTTYWFRTYARNSVGDAYGNVISFTTSAASIPSVTTSSVTSVNKTTATFNGNVTNANGDTVVSRGFVYNTTGNPTFESANVWTSGSGTGTFSENITGLNAGTTYYVKAYATNGIGRAYGSETSFTTQSVPLKITVNVSFTKNHPLDVGLFKINGVSTITLDEGYNLITVPIGANYNISVNNYTSSSTDALLISYNYIYWNDSGIEYKEVSVPPTKRRTLISTVFVASSEYDDSSFDIKIESTMM